MIEGKSLRPTDRIASLDINTRLEILVKAGEKCENSGSASHFRIGVGGNGLSSG
jgi:hypothetical protein